MFRQGLELLLSGLDDGLQFSQAGSCAEALTLLPDGGIDLVLLDLHMPDTSGLGSLQTLQQAGVTEPIVVLSGESAPYLYRPTSNPSLAAVPRRRQGRARHGRRPRSTQGAWRGQQVPPSTR